MNKVRELCVRNNIVQKELATMVGVSQPTVSDWFNNKANPKGTRLKKLSEIFGVSQAAILGYDDPPQNHEPPRDIREGMELYESLSPSQKKNVLEYMKFLVSQHEND